MICGGAKHEIYMLCGEFIRVLGALLIFLKYRTILILTRETHTGGFYENNFISG